MAVDRAKQIRGWIDFACDSNGVPELKYKIDFEFNASFTSRIGDASWNRKGCQRGRIRLSVQLWSRASEVDQYETVIHEACHIIAYYKFGTRIEPHGTEWKQTMGACDVEPERCHQVDRTGLKRKRNLFLISECPKKTDRCVVGAKTFNQLKEGATFVCRACKLKIGFHSVENHDG